MVSSAAGGASSHRNWFVQRCKRHLSVGSNSRRRRIVNVAPAVNPSDAVNLAQAQALAAAAAVSAAIVPASNGGADNTQHLIDGIRQELTNLRALAQRQQQDIAELKRNKTAAADAAAGEN